MPAYQKNEQKKLWRGSLRAEKNWLYIFKSSVLRKTTLLCSEEEKQQKKEENFPFHKQFMSVLKLLTIGSSFFYEEGMILSAEFQFKRSLLHIQCKFSSLLGLNAAFLDSQMHKKDHKMNDRCLLLYFLYPKFYILAERMRRVVITNLFSSQPTSMRYKITRHQFIF